MQRQLAWLLAVSLLESYRPHRLLHCGAKELSTFAAHARKIVCESALPIAELGLPVAALSCLQTVLVVELHQRARVHQLLQERRQLAAQDGAVLGQVFHQQVRQRVGIGAHADIDTGFAREFADQEHQSTQPRLELTIGRSVIALPDNSLVKLAEQHAGLQQVGRYLVEQEVGRYHRTHRIICGVADGVVNDAKLCTELTRRSCTIYRPQRVLPESPANGQQRIVFHQDRLVLVAGADPGAVQVTVDFPDIGVQRRLDGLDAVLSLGQNNPPGDRFDIIVRQFHIDCESALETLQRWRAGQGRLSGTHEEQAITKPLAAGFDDFLNDIGTVGIVSDVLLHLVEDNDRAGHIAVRRQRIL